MLTHGLLLLAAGFEEDGEEEDLDWMVLHVEPPGEFVINVYCNRFGRAKTRSKRPFAGL